MQHKAPSLNENKDILTSFDQLEQVLFDQALYHVRHMTQSVLKTRAAATQKPTSTLVCRRAEGYYKIGWIAKMLFHRRMLPGCSSQLRRLSGTGCIAVSIG